MRYLTIRKITFAIILVIAIMTICTSAATLVQAQEESGNEEIKTGLHIERSRYGLATVTLNKYFLPPRNYLGNYYYIVFSDYAAAHNGCERIKLKMSIGNIEAKEVKAASGRTYWVIELKMSDYPAYDYVTPILVRAEYVVATYRLKLIQGTDAYEKISISERKKYTAATSRFNYKDLAFQQYINQKGLKRIAGETDLDFAYRIYKRQTGEIKYVSMERYFKATDTINVPATNCAGIVTNITSILRDGGIPARVPCGYNVNQDISDSQKAYHSIIDIYVEGIGWITMDPAKQMLSSGSGETFGVFEGETIPWYYLDDADMGDKIVLGGKERTVCPANRIAILDDGISSPMKQEDYWSVKKSTN